MKKRAITTIFIILAIVIVVGVIGYTTLQKSQSEKYFSTQDNQEKIDLIKSEILSCIELSTTLSLSKLGAQGGFYSNPEHYYAIEQNEFILSLQEFIPYYYFNKQSFHPSKQIVQLEFSKIFNEEFSECISFIESDSIEISSSSPETQLKISEDKITISTSPNVAISSNGNSLTLTDLQTMTRNSALDDIITLYSDMTKTKVETEGFNCISCMEQFVIENNLYIEASNLDDDITIFRIYENYTLDQQSWIFINQEVI